MLGSARWRNADAGVVARLPEDAGAAPGTSRRYAASGCQFRRLVIRNRDLDLFDCIGELLAALIAFVRLLGEQAVQYRLDWRQVFRQDRDRLGDGHDADRSESSAWKRTCRPAIRRAGFPNYTNPRPSIGRHAPARTP
jgi:hypothetical protein